MKLGSLLSRNKNKSKPKTSKRLVGKLSGGCYRRRRKAAMTTNRGVVSVPRGWFTVVRKKFLVKAKLNPHNKNIIIIHNNTSIASNEEDNRASSCVDPTKDQLTKIKDAAFQDKKPADGVVVQDKSSTTTNAHVVDQDNDVKDESKKADDGDHVEDKTSSTITVNTKNDEGADDQRRIDLKDEDIKRDDGVVQDNSSMMVKTEEKLTLTNEDWEEEDKAGPSDEEKAMATIRIQAAFRGHLARRAFRALKSLVKLQAVVRGVVVRSQARMALHCMRALVRLGDRVRARQLLSRSIDE